MPRSAKLGWTLRSVVAPLVLSLALHGLVFLTLWFWPMRTPSLPLSIASTRITVDTCVRESPSSQLLPDDELPLDMREPNAKTTLAPRILDVPPLPGRSGETPVPPPRKTGETPVSPGSGGGSSGGSLFPLPATANSVVYVLDRSVSMGEQRKLEFARRELIASLRRLPPSVRFQVIVYNEYVEALLLDGRGGLLAAEPPTVEKAISRLQAVEAGGDTNHLAALRRGLALHPDVLYFLTDAGDLSQETVAVITPWNRGSVLHSIELTRRRAAQPEGTLARLARDNHGTYHCVSIPSSGLSDRITAIPVLPPAQASSSPRSTRDDR